MPYKADNFDEEISEVIWRQFLSGNQIAFSTIYNQFFVKLYNYGSRLSKNDELVYDSIQEVFVNLWEKKEKLHHVNSPKVYLFRCLRNKIIDGLKAKTKHIAEYIPANDFEISIEDKLIIDQASEETKNLLQSKIKLLSKRQKEAIFLLFYNNLTYSEISSVMSLQPRTVYNLMSTAISNLRKTITKNSIILQTIVSLLGTLALLFN